MHSSVSSLVGDLSPGLVLVLVAFLAATPPYFALSQTRRGRARSAIAYLLGLGAGAAVTILLVALLRAETSADTITAAGLIGSFFGPFLGMLRANWRRRPRPIRRRTIMEGLSR